MAAAAQGAKRVGEECGKECGTDEMDPKWMPLNLGGCLRRPLEAPYNELSRLLDQR